MAAGSGSMLGNGATITFTGTNASVGTVISIDPPEESVDDIPDDNLAETGFHQMLPGLVAHVGKTKITAVFNPDLIAANEAASPRVVPGLGVVSTATLTFRPRTGQTSGATYIGTAYVGKRQPSSLETDKRVTMDFELQHDGKTGPAWAAGT